MVRFYLRKGYVVCSVDNRLLGVEIEGRVIF